MRSALAAGLGIVVVALTLGCDEKPSNTAAPSATATSTSSAAAPTASAAASTTAAAASTSIPADPWLTDNGVTTTKLGLRVPGGAREEGKVNATFYYYKTKDKAPLNSALDALTKADGWTFISDRKAGGYRLSELHKGEQKIKLSVGCMNNTGECFISVQKL